MSEESEPVRNRRGCFIILAILALFTALLIFAAFSAQPGNDVAEKIPTVPTR